MKRIPRVAVTITMDEMTKARAIQAAMRDDRSLSDMCDWLIKLGLKTLYKGVVEAAITDPKQFIEVNKKS
jgi:hypothetical protein